MSTNGKSIREAIEYSRLIAQEFLETNRVPELHVTAQGQALARNVRDDGLLALWSRLRWRALKKFGYVKNGTTAEISAQVVPWQVNWGKAADEVVGQ